MPDLNGNLPGLNTEQIRRSWTQHQGQAHDERLLLWTWLIAQKWATPAGALAPQ
jgi:hypothetical protein